jgi:hypothetical protein
MSAVYMQTLAQVALMHALLIGIAVGWFFADVIELFWRKP